MTSTTTKIQENAVLGESMCSTLLLQRFWVLKRSVDINGGDFFIQLRDESVSFTDMLPPRIGIAQSKFSQTKKTTHFVKKEYVLGIDGIPLRGFFLIVHVGQGKESRRYILTSKEISEEFSISKKDGEPGYFIGASAYIDKFEFSVDELALNKIFVDLENRSEEDKKKFLQSVNIPDYELKKRGLKNEWLIPVPNEHAFISDEIYWMKLSLRTALYAYDEIQGLIGELLLSNDVVECMEIAEKIKQSSEIKEENSKFYLKPYLDALNLGEKLMPAITVHKARLSMLHSSGNLSSFTALCNMVEKALWEKFQTMEPKRKEVSPGRFAMFPVKISVGIEFDTAKKNIVKTDIIEDEKINLIGNFHIREEGEIFTDFEEGRVAGWRDMHRLSNRVAAEYFRIFFPMESVGDIKETVIMSD